MFVFMNTVTGFATGFGVRKLAKLACAFFREACCAQFGQPIFTSTVIPNQPDPFNSMTRIL